MAEDGLRHDLDATTAKMSMLRSYVPQRSALPLFELPIMDVLEVYRASTPFSTNFPVMILSQDEFVDTLFAWIQVLFFVTGLGKIVRSIMGEIALLCTN